MEDHNTQGKRRYRVSALPLDTTSPAQFATDLEHCMNHFDAEGYEVTVEDFSQGFLVLVGALREEEQREGQLFRSPFMMYSAVAHEVAKVCTHSEKAIAVQTVNFLANVFSQVTSSDVEEVIEFLPKAVTLAVQRIGRVELQPALDNLLLAREVHEKNCSDERCVITVFLRTLSDSLRGQLRTSLQ